MHTSNSTQFVDWVNHVTCANVICVSGCSVCSWSIDSNRKSFNVLSKRDSLRRFVKKRVQTHSLDIAQLSEQHIGLAARRNVQTDFSNAASVDGAPPGPVAEDAQSSTADRKSGGGRFRAFQRHIGSNNMTEVGRLYSQVKDLVGDEVMEKCLREGKEAKERWKDGDNVGQTSFGPSKKAIDRLQMRRCVGAEIATQAVVGGIADSLDRTIDEASVGDKKISDVLTKVRSVNKALTKTARVHEQQCISELREFRDRHSDAYRAEISTIAVSNVVQPLSAFDAAPSPAVGVNAVTFNTHTIGDIAADLCSYCANISGSHGNLLRSAESSWGHLHRELDGSESSESSSADEDTLDGDCLLLGSCICDVDGARANTKRNRFLRIMKDFFRMSFKELRGYLGGSRVIAKLQPSMPADTDETAAVELAELWGLDSDVRYLHISDMNFTPYDPIVQFATEATEEEALGAAKGDGETALKVLACLPRK